MSTQQKKQNLKNGAAALENLVAFDFEVHAFSEIHFRINRRLDVWPSTKRWYDLRTHEKGSFIELESFVKGHFKTIQEVQDAVLGRVSTH